MELGRILSNIIIMLGATCSKLEMRITNHLVLFISKLNKIRFFKAPAMVEMFAGMTWKE
jgi:hypothetical protein